MDGWVVAGIVVVGAGALLYGLQRFGLIDLTDKRRSSGRAGAGAMVGLGDVFFPTRAEAAQEIVQQRERTHEAPSPGDGDLGVYDGVVAITLDAPGTPGAPAEQQPRPRDDRD